MAQNCNVPWPPQPMLQVFPLWCLALKSGCDCCGHTDGWGGSRYNWQQDLSMTAAGMLLGTADSWYDWLQGLATTSVGTLVGGVNILLALRPSQGAQFRALTGVTR